LGSREDPLLFTTSYSQLVSYLVHSPTDHPKLHTETSSSSMKHTHLLGIVRAIYYVVANRRGAQRYGSSSTSFRVPGYSYPYRVAKSTSVHADLTSTSSAAHAIPLQNQYAHITRAARDVKYSRTTPQPLTLFVSIQHSLQLQSKRRSI
jgi:hypothetical protein